MKINSRHVAILLALILLSVGFGFGFDAAATALEKHRYPIHESLAESVEAAAERYQIPEPTLWAILQSGSGFASNAVSEDGKIGLMQISPETFAFICTTVMQGDEKEAGMLYDPTTNLTAGCAYLSYLYRYYGIREHAIAAYLTSIETVDAWLSDPQNLNAQGMLKQIPDAEIEKSIKAIQKTADIYTRLYYS